MNTQGETLGQHDGIDAFTIGQRRGLGVAVGERRYVVDVEAATQTVTVGDRADLLRGEVRVRDLVFVDDRPLDTDVVNAQVRAHGEPMQCTIEGDRVVWKIAQPRVAPGQIVVFYRDDVVLGGGIALG